MAAHAYLNDARHLSLMEVGRIAWVVYLAADIGCIASGLLGGVLIKRGIAPVASRLWMMGGAALILPLSPLVAFVPSAEVAVMIAALAAFGHLTWQVTLGALVVDLYPKPVVGTVFGLVAAGSGLGGMLSSNLVGQVVSAISYTPIFVAMGFLHPLAWLMLARAVTGRLSSTANRRAASPRTAS